MLKHKILVIGLGSCGGTIVDALAGTYNRDGLECLAIDTDEVDIVRWKNARVISAGKSRTDGFSCGGNVKLGESAILDVLPQMKESLKVADIVVVIAGLGKGFGSGASLELSRYLKSQRINSLFLVTMPFVFEGNQLVKCADQALARLKESALTIIPVSLDLLHSVLPEDLSMSAVMSKAREAVINGSRALVDVLMVDRADVLPLDFSTVVRAVKGRSVECGLCFAVCEEANSDRISEQFFNSPLSGGKRFLEDGEKIIIKVSAANELSSSEIQACIDGVQKRLPETLDVVIGMHTLGEHEGVRFAGLIIHNKNKQQQINEDDSEKGNMVQPELPLIEQSTGVFTGPAKVYTKDGFDMDIPTFQRKGVRIDKGEIIKK